MLTAAQCRALATEYIALSKARDVSARRAMTLKLIGHSFRGPASQLDRLAADIRDEEKLEAPQLGASLQIPLAAQQ
jgi:hypothetical protein